MKTHVNGLSLESVGGFLGGGQLIASLVDNVGDLSLLSLQLGNECLDKEGESISIQINQSISLTKSPIWQRMFSEAVIESNNHEIYQTNSQSGN